MVGGLLRLLYFMSLVAVTPASDSTHIANASGSRRSGQSALQQASLIRRPFGVVRQLDCELRLCDVEWL